MTKQEHYESLLPQVRALCDGESDMIAKMANVAALLHHEFHFWWTGFYRVDSEEWAVGSTRGQMLPTTHYPLPNALILGPFQGPIACVRIAYGRGVCGTAWKERRTVVVPDVEQFPGHIACSAASRSEIVVPLIKDGEAVAVLDIDSEQLGTFDDTDAHYLEEVARILVG